MTERFKGVTGADLLRCQFTLKLWECLLPLTLAGAPKRTSPPPQEPLWELQGWPLLSESFLCYSSNSITKKEPKSDDHLLKFDWHDLSLIFFWP